MRSVSTDRQAGLDAVQAERGVEDDAGEAHAAGGGPEQLRVRLGGDPAAAVGGRHDGHRLDGVAPRAGAVVVLAVDVGGDGAADGDLAGARA